jgi:L-asparaginase
MGWISPAVSETLSETFMNISEVARLEVYGDLSMA